MGATFYSGKDVLITGGAGFVGSNLAHALSSQGARVSIVDSFHPDYGGNEHNLAGLEAKPGFKLVRGEIGNKALLRELCDEADVVFHIAAQCSHVDSMIQPALDIEYNCNGTISVLEGARHSRRKPAVVYAGTRAIVGAPLELPATERTLPNPTDLYGVNKLAAELYCSVYARVYGVPAVSLRLTNSFGPRHQMKNGKYGIMNWFISLGLQGKPIKVFGTGEQLRDYLYADDAIEAFVRAGEFAASLREGKTCAKAQLAGERVPFATFNVGSGKGIRFVDVARKIAEATGAKVEMVPWPADRAAIETGDFIADSTAASEALGWKPWTSFDDGLRKTVEFYRKELKYYL